MQYSNTIQGKFIDRPNRFIAHVAIPEAKQVYDDVLVKGAQKRIKATHEEQCAFVVATEETSNIKNVNHAATQEKTNKQFTNDTALQEENLLQIVTVHVKNTGRCKELLLPGVAVTLAVSDNPNRKTQFDLVSVYKDGVGWINIDSQAPNVVVKEWLESRPTPFRHMTFLKPEYTFGNSRVDFYLECGKRKILIEVKGCTLEIDGVGYFPDAPTERGVKHLRELASAAGRGYECYIAFVIAMPGITKVLPNVSTHPEFGRALAEARQAGVNVLLLPCEVTPDSLQIKKAIIKNK